MSSREQILGRLGTAPKPFPLAQSPENRLHVTPLSPDDKEALLARFIKETQALSCDVQVVDNDTAAVERILAVIAGQYRILSWNFEHIPCRGLQLALHEAGVMAAPADDPDALFGLTGANAALAATGSLVIVSGPGRHRTTALLPQSHIAVITQDQILPDFESWLHEQRDHKKEFNQPANINIVSGPSRTADIAMELILGMHGPASLHIVIIAR